MEFVGIETKQTRILVPIFWRISCEEANKSFLYMLNLGIHDTAWFSSDKKLTLVQEEAESRDLYSDLQNI